MKYYKTEIDAIEYFAADTGEEVMITTRADKDRLEDAMDAMETLQIDDMTECEYDDIPEPQQSLIDHGT